VRTMACSPVAGSERLWSLLPDFIGAPLLGFDRALAVMHSFVGPISFVVLAKRIHWDSRRNLAEVHKANCLSQSSKLTICRFLSLITRQVTMSRKQCARKPRCWRDLASAVQRYARVALVCALRECRAGMGGGR
jgi:hypothetical protein